MQFATEIPESVESWLMKQQPWTRYACILGKSDHPQSDPVVQDTYLEMAGHPQVSSLLAELEGWPGPVMKRHNDAKVIYHKLVFLADLGLRSDTEEITRVADLIISNPSEDGPFQISGNIPTVFGGTGRDEWIWMMCDAPLLTYALVKLGYGDDPRVKRSVEYLLSLIQDFGWPCAATSALGKRFKGPGKRTDPCPYANLIMLRLITSLPWMMENDLAKKGAEVLLRLWENRKEMRYFLFGMGTDFRKLKAPFIWYDILHVTSVLSRFSFLRGDERLREMVEVIASKGDNENRYKAESVYLSWKEWDFGQKRVPSGWITIQVYQILQRWARMNG